MGLKIPRLFVLCFFWRLRVVFKRFPTNVGVRKHFESRAAVSIARFLHGPDFEGKLGQGWDCRVVGWEAEETQREFVMHLPIAFLVLWKWGQEGKGPVAGQVAAGESRGPVLRRGCQSAVRWGGDAQPCMQFPTGLAIRHRRCELPGMTYFPAPGQPWPGVGPAERLARPSPGTSPTALPGSQSGCSVTPWHPSPGCLSGLLGSELAPARQTLAFQAPVGGEVLETKILSW